MVWVIGCFMKVLFSWVFEVKELSINLFIIIQKKAVRSS